MLKYTLDDTEKLIDVFASIQEENGKLTELRDEILKLIDYPVQVIQEFLKCMEALDDKSQDYLIKNYKGIIGYVTMRLNLVECQ